MKSTLIDPTTHRSAVVSKYRALRVTNEIPDVQPTGTQNRYTLFNATLGTGGFIEDNNLTTTNMNVDGSSAAVEFYGAASTEVDIRIMRIVVILADSAVAHNSFGNVAALSTGFDIQVFERGLNTPLITKAKTGGQFIAQSGLYAPYGNTSTTWELTNWTGTEDAQTIVLDVSAIVPGGIRLARATEDKIFATVNDDLQGLTEFTVRVMGYRHHE